MEINQKSCQKLAIYLLLIVTFSTLAFAKGKQPPKVEQKPEPAIEKAIEQPSKESQEPVTSEKEVAPTVSEPISVTEEAKPQVESAETKLEPETPATELPAATVVEEAAPKIPAGSKVHTVWVWQETRDCLWQLAKKYYGDPWQWKKIYEANRNTILDPTVIFPKQKIIIPPTNQ